MTFAVQVETPPLSQDADGALRVGDPRVLLELIVRAFQDGATPETIAQRYATRSLEIDSTQGKGRHELLRAL